MGSSCFGRGAACRWRPSVWTGAGSGDPRTTVVITTKDAKSQRGVSSLLRVFVTFAVENEGGVWKVSHELAFLVVRYFVLYAETRAVVGYSKGRGTISTKKCALTLRFRREDFWKRRSPKIATHWCGTGKGSICRAERLRLAIFGCL